MKRKDNHAILSPGTKVIKLNSRGNKPKPFKSGRKVNTIKEVITHPQLGCLAYTFVEDESYVAAYCCVESFIDEEVYQKWRPAILNSSKCISKPKER